MNSQQQKGLQGTLARWWQWLRPMVMTIGILLMVRSAIADWYVVPTGSMKPSIIEGDRIFVNKLAYALRLPFTNWRLADWSEPQRFDVIVFYAPGSGTRMVKRVVGLPGDVVEMKRNRLIINGHPIDYHLLTNRSLPLGRYLMEETAEGRAHNVLITPWVPSLRSFGPLTTPQDHYFVLGDNRDGSLDSRSYGLVKRDRILGRSTRIVLSLDPDNYHMPRWRRFFHELP